MPSTACSNCKRKVGSSDISALATSFAFALDSGARPEKPEFELEEEYEVGADDEADAGGTAGPLGQIMNPTRTTANNPSALAAMTFVRFSLPIFT
jgi:hypothetical protein